MESRRATWLAMSTADAAQGDTAADAADPGKDTEAVGGSDTTAPTETADEAQQAGADAYTSAAAEIATLDADDAVLLQGVVDCFFEEDGELVGVDFKTDRIGRTQIEERAEHYRPQLEAYSMALMRVMGKKVREKVLYFFSVGEEKVL